MKLTSDKFKKARGGYSRLLLISCEKCTTRICFYQKDGPGILKRMYVDRMIGLPTTASSKELMCPSCKRTLGIRMVYKKENRSAYRLFVDAITKKVVNANSIK